MALTSSLKHRPFALLWSGQTLSRLGDSVFRIALSWWVLEKTGSAAAMGTVMILAFAPMLIFLLFGGLAADRLPRLRVMFASDIGRAVVVGLVAALGYSGQLEVWHIYVGSLLFGFVEAFFQPAYVAVIPQIMPGELLLSANSLTTLSGTLASVVGPALGAAIVHASGESTAFVLNSLSFVVSAACMLPLLGLSLPQKKRDQESRASMVGDLREGINAVLASPWLWITIAVAAVSNIFLSGPIGVALPFLVRDSLHLDVDALGWIYSASSIGSVLAAIWLGRYQKIHRRGLIVYAAWIVGSLMIAVMGLPVTIFGVVLASFVSGAALAVIGLLWTNTLQELVAPDLLGRVSSIDQLGSFALIPVGYGVTGWVTDRIGAPLSFVFGGVAGAILAILGLIHPGVRNLD